MAKLADLDLEAGIEAFPIPPVEANVARFDAGVLTFGVEYRYLTAEVARESLLDNERAGRKVLEDVNELDLEPAEGVSIHVFGTADGGEYLRFDCFDNEPHYHYLDPHRPWVNRLTFDPVANGDMLEWTLERLRTRLPEMLERTGGAEELLAGLDLDLVDKALDGVATRARASQEHARSLAAT